MAVRVEQDIFGLEVAVDDVVFVEMLECESDLRYIEASLFF